MEPDFWHWWIVATLFLVVEVFVPGAFFVWIGIGSFLTGLAVLAGDIIGYPLGFEVGLILFSFFSLVSVWGGRVYLKKRPERLGNSTLNRRGAQYVGRILTLSGPIVNGRGHVRIDDTLWSVSGPDCPEGVLVRIVGVEGSLLIVEPAGDDVEKQAISTRLADEGEL